MKADTLEHGATAARDRFLVSLDDATRSLHDAPEIAQIAVRSLAEGLGIDRIFFAERFMDGQERPLFVEHAPGLPPWPHPLQLEEPALREALEARRAFIESDMTRRPERERYDALQIRALAAVPVYEQDRLVAVLLAAHRQPRAWSEGEIDLIRRVAERCWASIQRARHTERTRRESEDRLQLILRNVRDHAIFLLDPEGRVMEWNVGAEQMFGWTAEEMLGQEPDRLFTPEDLAQDRPSVERELALQGRVADDDRVHMRKDGSRFFASGSLEALRDEEGALRGFVKVVRDITEKKRMEEEHEQLLRAERQARAEAEQLGRLKDEFLATLSHELRTPLTSILGWAHLLRREGMQLPPEVSHGLDAIYRNARSQAQLIDDLLDMNRVMSGKVRLEFGMVDLDEVLGIALDIVRPSALAKGVQLSAQDSGGLAPVLGDASRLQQILWNLLSNAVKFTPEGGRIEARVRLEGGEVRVEVSDTGVGIPPHFLPHVFERFRQQDPSTTRQHGGLGLGLSIVKHLVELHGGRVWAESEGEGRGATFIAAFPALASWEDLPRDSSLSDLPSVSEGELDLRGITVLVVEDEPDARSLLEQFLSSCEATVVVASSATEALERLREAVPHVLVSDICMPQMDGYELIRKVRQLPAAQGGTVPAIALTAFARAEDRDQALRAGYQQHLVKPLAPRELVLAIHDLVAVPDRPMETPEPTPTTLQHTAY